MNTVAMIQTQTVEGQKCLTPEGKHVGAPVSGTFAEALSKVNAGAVVTTAADGPVVLTKTNMPEQGTVSSAGETKFSSPQRQSVDDGIAPLPKATPVMDGVVALPEKMNGQRELHAGHARAKVSKRAGVDEADAATKLSDIPGQTLESPAVGEDEVVRSPQESSAVATVQKAVDADEASASQSSPVGPAVNPLGSVTKKNGGETSVHVANADRIVPTEQPLDDDSKGSPPAMPLDKSNPSASRSMALVEPLSATAAPLVAHPNLPPSAEPSRTASAPPLKDAVEVGAGAAYAAAASHDVALRHYEAASPDRLEVSISGGSLGWMTIRTELDRDGNVHALLRSSEESVTTLRGHVNEMATFLSAQSVPVAHIAVEPVKLTGSGAAMLPGEGARQNGDDARGQNRGSDKANSGSSEDGDGGRLWHAEEILSGPLGAAVNSGQALASTGGWLSVRV